MGFKITIFFLLLCANVSAQINHYVSTTGNDGTGTGAIGAPWRTVHFAATQVSTVHDTIFVNAGTYNETLPAFILPGVNVNGAGITSHVVNTYKANWNFDNPTEAAFVFLSNTEGTNGDQTISNLLLDGSGTTGNIAILVRCRSNVTIHDMTIKDFYINGITMLGSSVSNATKPLIYSINNKIQNCIIDNCSDSDATYIGQGLINFAGQKNWDVSYCTLSDTSRAPGRNGDIMLNNRFGLGGHYHNNTSYKPSSENDHWNMHLEIPWGTAGTEIDNNIFYGGDTGIDIGCFSGIYDYSYPFLFDIHDNLFDDSRGYQYGGTHGKNCITIEGVKVVNTFIHNNTFNHIGNTPLNITDGHTGTTLDSNIVFNNNILFECGQYDNTKYQSLISIYKAQAVDTVIGIKIINNTITPNALVNSTGFNIDNIGYIRGVTFANNIVTNGKNGYWMNVSNTGGGTIDSLTVRNCNLYNNPNANAATFAGNAVLHYLSTGNITTDPLFGSSTNLHLQTTSPNINAAYPYGYGIDIGGYFKILNGTKINRLSKFK